MFDGRLEAPPGGTPGAGSSTGSDGLGEAGARFTTAGAVGTGVEATGAGAIEAGAIGGSGSGNRGVAALGIAAGAASRGGTVTVTGRPSAVDGGRVAGICHAPEALLLEGTGMDTGLGTVAPGGVVCRVAGVVCSDAAGEPTGGTVAGVAGGTSTGTGGALGKGVSTGRSLRRIRTVVLLPNSPGGIGEAWDGVAETMGGGAAWGTADVGGAGGWETSGWETGDCTAPGRAADGTASGEASGNPGGAAEGSNGAAGGLDGAPAWVAGRDAPTSTGRSTQRFCPLAAGPTCRSCTCSGARVASGDSSITIRVSPG